jgi:hypothetical protein
VRLQKGVGAVAADALREEGGDLEMPGQDELVHDNDDAHGKVTFFAPSPMF